MKNKLKALSLLIAVGVVSVSVAKSADDKGKKKEKPAAAATGAPSGATAPTDAVFYVFENRGSRLNHYVPSGWMGDYGDLKMNQGWSKNASASKGGAKGEDK